MSDAVAKLLAKFVEHPLHVDFEGLQPDVRQALPHLAAAMRGMDRLFHRQLGPEVVGLMERLEKDGEKGSLLHQAVRHFNGPYDKLAGGESFVPGIDKAPPHKALYPRDLTVEEFERAVASQTEDKEALLSPTTVIVREGERLKAIPYTDYYREELLPVAENLKRAGGMIQHQGLRHYLNNRAEALLGNYPLRQSDAEWVQLTDAPLEVVIGPYEVYEDGLKGLKAFYEGMLLQVDLDAAARLKQIEESLSALAAEVPTPADSKPAVGGVAPMVVADELLATGDGYSGLLAAAFNLPNDPWVRREVGWKQVMIRNVMQAKFDACSTPIAQRMLPEAQVRHIGFEPYFFFILLHEVSHGLGPAYRADGRSINEACGKYHSTLEEAKADTGSIVLLTHKSGQHGIPAFPLEQVGASYLAGLYRSLRFGMHEAHGQANLVAYNYYRHQGVLNRQEATGKIAVDSAKLPQACRSLLHHLCTLQAAGDDREIAGFLDEYGQVPEELEAAIESLADLPTDIRPVYPV